MNGLEHVLWLVPLSALLAYSGTPRFRNRMARDRLVRMLRHGLPAGDYTVLRGIEIPAQAHSRTIPVCVVSPFGVFVIGICMRAGRLNGTRVQARWAQTRWWKKHRFDNPLHINDFSVEALARYLALPASRFHSVVFFSSSCRLQQDVPDAFDRLDDLVESIRSRTQLLLHDLECERLVAELKSTRPASARLLPGKTALTSWALGLLVLAGLAIAFRPQIGTFVSSVQSLTGRPSTGTAPPTETLLNCAYSSDTGRCACQDADGRLVQLDAEACRARAN